MKKLIITVIAALSAMAMNAQSRHEFSVSAGGGLSSMQYELAEGDYKLGFGGNIGLGYTFFFSEHFGLGTGAEFSLFNSTGAYNNNFLNSLPSTDGVEAYEQRYYLNGFEEKQQSLLVNIPLMFQYQTGGKHRFYLSAGAKLGIPVRVSYKSTASEISSTGYYAAQNVEYSTQEFLGFGQLQGNKSEGDSDLKLAVMASLEAGMKWRVGEKSYLYTGIYADYGLNNIADPGTETFILREGTDMEYITNGLFASQYTRNAEAGVESYTMVEKIRPLAVGIKLRFSIGTGCFGAKKKAQEAVEEIAPITETPAEPTPVNSQAEAQQAPAAKTEAEAKPQAEAEAVAKRTQAETQTAAKKAQAESDLKEIKNSASAYKKGDTALSDLQKAELDKKIALLKQYPHLRIICEGHTCDIGSSESNIRVGQKRADAAKAYLVEQGIAPERIDTQSKGETNPIAPNTSEENRRLNRRVEFLIVN